MRARTLTSTGGAFAINEHGDLQRLGDSDEFGEQFLELLRKAGWCVERFTPLGGYFAFGISAENEQGLLVNAAGDSYSDVAVDVFSECARLQQMRQPATQLALL